jgi:hypothetical protein
MKSKVYEILSKENINPENQDIENLKKVGIENIINNLEFYWDKPYSCESVFKELFSRAILDKVKSQSN